MEGFEMIQKISKRLSEAFKQINLLCVSYLAQQKQDNNRKHQRQQNKERQKEQKTSQKNKQKTSSIHKQIEEINEKKIQSSEIVRPKQPLSAFFLFMNQKRRQVMQIYPKMSVKQLANIMGEVWTNMSEQEKRPYLQESFDRKQNYVQQMSEFYQKYPEERDKKKDKKKKKQKEKQQKQAHETHENTKNKRNNDNQREVKHNQVSGVAKFLKNFEENKEKQRRQLEKNKGTKSN